jgi:universal stress protein E
MKLLDKILLPIDVNTDYSELVSATVKLANAYNSEIILLHVINDNELRDNIKNIVVKSVTDTLNEIKDTLKSNNIKVREPEIVFGKIVETIVQKSISEKVNLILIGAKEKKKKDKFKLGIIAEQIIRESDMPVWMVKGEGKTLFSNVLCPVDFSEPSKRALTNAVILAKKFNAKLNIITVFEPIDYVSKRISLDLDEENANQLKKVKHEMKEFLKEFVLEDVVHKIEIKKGKAYEKILNTIKSQNIDLLIMGTNGRSGLSRFFMGSVTEKVIREMPCSFFTIKKIDVIQLKIDGEVNEIGLHFKNGEELIENGLYEDAINQFTICLQINFMHIPSINKLVDLYNIIGDTNKSQYFENMAKQILTNLWDRKIEEEIRKHYKFGK